MHNLLHRPLRLDGEENEAVSSLRKPIRIIFVNRALFVLKSDSELRDVQVGLGLFHTGDSFDHEDKLCSSN